MKPYLWTQEDDTSALDKLTRAIGELEAQLADFRKAAEDTEQAIKDMLEVYHAAQKDHYRERGE